MKNRAINATLGGYRGSHGARIGEDERKKEITIQKRVERKKERKKNARARLVGVKLEVSRCRSAIANDDRDGRGGKGGCP